MKKGQAVIKKYRREQLTTWLSYKDHTPYYVYLDLLNKVVQSIFKQEQTINDHEELTLGIADRLSGKSKKLFLGLVKSITLLNHTYRVFTEQGYCSLQEDVLSAAALLQMEINPESLLPLKSKLIYWELKEQFGAKEFGVREAMTFLLIPRSTTARHLRYLENTDYIQKVRTGPNNKSYYQLN